MAKVHPNGKTKGDLKHVRVNRYEFECPAYRALSPGARALLGELKYLYSGTNNGDLFLSCRDAGVRVNVNKDTATGLFEELQHKGFIRPRQKGSFTQKVKHATTWVLTEFDFYGQTATKDFMRWQPGSDYPAEPRRSSKIKTRSPRTGQAVRNGGTRAQTKRPSCPLEPDKTGGVEPIVGPLKPDTFNIPRGAG